MRVLLTALVLALFPLAASAQYEDTIMMSGKPILGEVQKETYKDVTIVLQPSGTMNPTWDQIQGDIIFDEQSIPPAMSNGKRNMAAGNYKQAILNFEKAMGGGTRTVLKQHILFNMAKCYQLDGDLKKAVESFKKLLTEYPDSKFIRDIYPAMVECAMFSNDLNGSLAVIKESLSKAKDLGMSDEFMGDMRLKEARIYELQKQDGPAQGVYNGLTSHKTQRIAFAAQVGLGRCLFRAKDIEKAKSTFQRVVDACDNTQPMILSGAYNGLGDYYYQTSKDDPKVVKEALLCYLRSVTLYLPGANDLTDNQEYALCYAANCFRRLSDLETDEAKKDKLMNEHFRLAGRLKDNFKGSPYIGQLIK
ncbi:MAG: tetratricopeptide repeat protein [Planctomycetes bacterium]|nr:tetratricopeptide repeat protein [Planctomycetota bacterium]